MKKRGQLTIFIIVGILLVAFVSLFFLMRAGFLPQLGGGGSQSSVNAFLNTCLESEVDGSIELILKNGGYVDSPPLSLNFLIGEESVRVSYLCYTRNDYEGCVNQNPVLFKSVENEIKESISQVVDDCFQEMVYSFERQGNEVDSEYSGFEVSLVPKSVNIQTDSKVTLTKSGETTVQENFKITVSTRLYEILTVVQEAINKESGSCDFNHRAYEVAYPEINIDKYSSEDSSDVYIIGHDKTNEEFIFAVRGCILPPY